MEAAASSSCVGRYSSRAQFTSSLMSLRMKKLVFLSRSRRSGRTRKVALSKPTYLLAFLRVDALAPDEFLELPLLWLELV